MAAISRLRVAWTGSGVTGGGLSTFYTEGAPLQLQLAIKDLFLGTVRTLVPTVCTMTVPAAGETFDSATGLLTGAWSEGTAQVIPGINNGNYAAGVGTRILWNTAGITRGRRVIGSTFIVPLGVSCYSADGSLNDSNRGDLATAAQGVVVALGDDMVVWSRPIGGAGGAIWTVNSGTVPDKVSWLRSRRT
jgi:hypothetical protein